MKYISEKSFETDVKQFLKDKGCWTLKTWGNGVQRKGVPDLLVCCNGMFLGIELKSQKGKFDKEGLQMYNIREIRKAGGIAMVLRPDQYEAFKILIQKIIDGDEIFDIPEWVFRDE